MAIGSGPVCFYSAAIGLGVVRNAKSPTHYFCNTGGIRSQQGLTLSGFREASAVDVDAEELISREGWSIEILPALSNH